MITAQCRGVLLAGHTHSFLPKDQEELPESEQEQIAYGKVQVLQKEPNGFYRIEDIKVARDNFGFLPDCKALMNKPVLVEIEQRSYQGKVSNYLAAAPKPATNG